MSMNRIMHLVLDLCKKLLCRFCCAVIIKCCGIDVRYLLIESTLRQTDLTNLLKQTIKVFRCEHRTTIFQALVIHDPSFDGIVLCNLIYPFTELHRTLRIDLESNSNYHLQGIVICAVAFSISGSYSKFSNN